MFVGIYTAPWQSIRKTKISQNYLSWNRKREIIRACFSIKDRCRYVQRQCGAGERQEIPQVSAFDKRDDSVNRRRRRPITNSNYQTPRKSKGKKPRDRVRDQWNVRVGQAS